MSPYPVLATLNPIIRVYVPQVFLSPARGEIRGHRFWFLRRVGLRRWVCLSCLRSTQLLRQHTAEI